MITLVRSAAPHHGSVPGRPHTVPGVLPVSPRAAAWLVLRNVWLFPRDQPGLLPQLILFGEETARDS